MKEINVSLQFGTEFEGTLQADDRQIAIGRKAGGMASYELLLGALGSCYYATFISIARKMRLEYEGADIAIHGVKRDKIPETLQTVEMTITIRGAQDEKGFDRASELAAKYCSVHETIAQVADIALELRFA
ncbi:MAG: OsmC family protein [Christensenellales bacterium]|jgi:putative redox protein